MSDPRRDPETGGRSLADILREAGVESPRAGKRRRDTGENPVVRQRGSRGGDGDTGRVAEAPPFGRRAGDTGKTPPVPPADPVKARVRTPADPLAGRARPAGDLPLLRGRGSDGPTTAAIPGLRPSRKPGVPGAPGAHGADDGPSTGPIPVVRGDDPPLLDDEPAGGALAWVRFGGELVVALAAGVGIYLLFTVLWEQLPRITVVIAPLAVTALVAAVGAWRHRLGGEALGLRLVVVLVFAGTLLTVAPAAALLGGT